jgi:photosystem II stability/assembly factor-like uncharacterized protein
MDSGTTQDLLSVWGNGPTDVFAVGAAGTIVHYDGQQWASQESNTSATLRDVWAVSQDNVFALGDGGTILQYANGAWAPMESGVSSALHSVWGSSLQNVYAVGAQGTVLKFDGLTWAKVDAGVTKDLFGVWVEPGALNRVIAVGDGSTIRSYGPNGWEPVGGAYGVLSSVWGSSFNDIYVVSRSKLIYHFNGIVVNQSWTTAGGAYINGHQITSGPIIAIHGQGDNILAVDEANALLKFVDY